VAALRSEVERKDRGSTLVESEIPYSVVIDHSHQVDYFGPEDAYEKNVELEYGRNA
jgi:aconitate hydratase